MDEKKTKAVIYLKIVFLTMIYLGQRHPYMTVGLMVWCMGCIGIAISRSFSLGMMLIIGVEMCIRDRHGIYKYADGC